MKVLSVPSIQKEGAWLALFFLLLGAIPKVFGAETVHSYPREVTVFPDSARVTREGSLKLAAGSHQVLFPDLPASIVESSLRLTVEGPEGTKLYGVSLKNDYQPEVVEKRTRALKGRLQALQDQETDLNDRMEARKTEIDLLKNLAKEGSNTATNQGATHVATLVDFTHSADAVEGRISKLLAANRKDERRVRELGLKIDALNNQLSDSGSPEREKRTAQADIELPRAGEARFTLAYQVADASWTPLYDLRLSTEAEKPGLDLAFNAQVRQKTGEDWKGVTLTLSTARPTEGTQLPDPTNWWLDFITGQTDISTNGIGLARMPLASAKGADARFGVNFQAALEEKDGDADEPAAAPPAPAEVVTAQILQAPYAMSFAIPRSRDIPSDGADHRVGIAQNSQKVEIKLVAVPRLSAAAYLEAHITYDGVESLLPGEAQLFRDGDFVGTTSLEAKAPGETFDLGFGQDDSVRVERKLVKNQAGQAGGVFDFHKGERRYTWVTTVANYHPGLRTIEIREQLPRSRQKDITVETTEVTPKPVAEDSEKPGLYCWKLDLAAKAKTKVTFGYDVKYPENQEVTGLE